MCVIILGLLLILIHDSGDEEGLSAAVTTVSECEADSGVQLTGEADTVWPGRPGAPSDSQECPTGHTQSSDISESGRVSVSIQVAVIYSPFYWLPDYYYRLDDADTRP